VIFELPEEVIGIRNAVSEFAKKEIKPVADEYHKKKEYPWEIVRKAAKLGYVASHIPEEYGGSGVSALAGCVIVEEVCRADPGVGGAFINHIGAEQIIYFGTEEQKKKYLPPLARGEQICGICLTESQGGSEVAGITTRAEETSDEYVINGNKIFISNAPVASYLLVTARTSPDRYGGLSTFIVETNLEGVDISTLPIIDGYSLSPTGEISFSNVGIPKENLVGKLNNGFFQAMKWLDRFRPIVTAMCVGVAQGAYDLALEYAKTREQFGRKIFGFQSIRFKLADMAMKIEAARLMLYKNCALLDEDIFDTKFASMAKLFASEVVEEVASNAVSIHGAYGCSTDYPLYRYYATAKVTQIIEGTSEIHREVISRRL
jgi:alkylation response protein AidB-like acyl-CoA dehydrogenase